MKAVMKQIGRALLAVSLGAALVSEVRADRTVSIPRFKAQPNGLVTVPVMLDKASEVASIKIVINYDRQVLDFVSAETGSGLGSAFDLVSSENDGVITLIFSRAISLSDGSGTMALLKFHANAGASANMDSDLAVASCEFSDDSGVRNLNIDEPVVPASGKITITLGVVDNNANKIPDDWESANGMSTTSDDSGRVSAATGFSPHIQYAFGMTPTNPDAKRMPSAATGEYDGKTHLTVQFHRRRDAGSLIEYLVEECTDLTTWQQVDVNSHQVGSAVVEDATLERVTVRGNLTVGASDSPRKGFMRVRVVYH